MQFDKSSSGHALLPTQPQILYSVGSVNFPKVSGVVRLDPQRRGESRGLSRSFPRHPSSSRFLLGRFVFGVFDKFSIDLVSLVLKLIHPGKGSAGKVPAGAKAPYRNQIRKLHRRSPTKCTPKTSRCPKSHSLPRGIP